MVKLKNPRPVRLLDHSGRFDLKPGDVIEFESVPKDLMGLVKKGYLKEVVLQQPVDKLKGTDKEPEQVKVEKSDSSSSLPAADKGKAVSSQKENVAKPKPKTKGK